MKIFKDGVAPEGATSSAQCIMCEGFYPEDWQRFEAKFRVNIPCGCGSRTSNRFSTIYISQDSAHLLEPDKAKSEVWYHVTSMENWHETLLDTEINPVTPLVHVGTLKAALERMEYFVANHWDEQSYHLYAVTLKEGARLDPNIYDDEDKWPSEVGYSILFRKYSTFRYVNKFESPGSISLLADPRDFTVQSAMKFDWEEASDFADGILGKLVRQPPVSTRQEVMAPPVILDPIPL